MSKSVEPKDPEEGLVPPRDGKTYDNAEVVGILKEMDKLRRCELMNLWTKFDETGKYIGKGRYHCLYTNKGSLRNAIRRANQNKRIRPTGKPGRNLLVSNAKLKEWAKELTQNGDTFTLANLQIKIVDLIVEHLKEAEAHLPPEDRTDYALMRTPKVGITALKRTAARQMSISPELGVTTSAIYEPARRRIAKRSLMGAITMLTLIVHSHYLPADTDSQEWNVYKQHLNDLDKLVAKYYGMPMMAVPSCCIFNTDDAVVYLFEGAKDSYCWRFHDTSQSGATHAKHMPAQRSSTGSSHGIRVRSKFCREPLPR